MGWVSRGRNRYYYRNHRLGKRVVSEYVGSGISALHAETEDRLRKDRRVEEKRMKAQQMEMIHHFRKAERPAVDLEKWIQSIYESALLSAGFHQHHREWRRRRCQNQ